MLFLWHTIEETAARCRLSCGFASANLGIRSLDGAAVSISLS